MLKEILLKDIKNNLNTNSTKLIPSFLKSLDEDEKERIEKLITKEILSLEDINDLLIDYFSFELSNQELYNIILKEKALSKTIPHKNNRELIKSLILKYLITHEKYQDKIIGMYINVDIDLINKLDKNLFDQDYQNNQEIIDTLDKLSHINNQEFITTIKKIKKIYNLSSSSLINIVNIFYPYELPKYNNTYYQYQKIISKLAITKTTNPKEIALLLLLLTDDIKYVENITLTKEDLITFIKKIESNNLSLTTNQINNLFTNFKIKYLKDNNKEEFINDLSLRLITSYDEFYNNNFYFKTDDFINYYNKLYNDDFSSLLFSNKREPLTRNIFDSYFYNNGINESVIALESDLIEFNSFKPMLLDYKINCLENDKLFYERYKFYLIYLNHLKAYFEVKNDITIEYYILKNIPINDRGEFYELAKIYYGKSFSQIARNGHTITNVTKLMKKEFEEELSKISFDARYEILNKYKSYCTYLKILPHLNEKELLKIVKEYEQIYYNPTKVHKKTKKKSS